MFLWRTLKNAWCLLETSILTSLCKTSQESILSPFYTRGHKTANSWDSFQWRYCQDAALGFEQVSLTLKIIFSHYHKVLPHAHKSWTTKSVASHMWIHPWNYVCLEQEQWILLFKLKIILSTWLNQLVGTSQRSTIQMTDCIWFALSRYLERKYTCNNSQKKKNSMQSFSGIFTMCDLHTHCIAKHLWRTYY